MKWQLVYTWVRLHLKMVPWGLSTHWPKGQKGDRKTNLMCSKFKATKKMFQEWDSFHLTTGLLGISSCLKRNNREKCECRITRKKTEVVTVGKFLLWEFSDKKKGPRLLSVLWGKSGRRLSHKQNKLHLVGTQCCLTFYCSHVMIYARTLSI